MKLRIMLGVTVNADHYCLLKGKKRDILADLSAIVHTLAAAKNGGVTEYIYISPSTIVDDYASFELDSAEEIAAVLNRCKAYRKELALQLLAKVKA